MEKQLEYIFAALCLLTIPVGGYWILLGSIKAMYKGRTITDLDSPYRLGFILNGTSMQGATLWKKIAKAKDDICLLFFLTSPLAMIALVGVTMLVQSTILFIMALLGFNV